MISLHGLSDAELVGLAKSDDTHIETILRLCRINSPKIRMYCAARSDVPTSMLTEMSNDPHFGVRSMVAYNTLTPSDVISRLAVDTNEKVRWSVARNVLAPADLLKVLAQDPSTLVSDAAQSSPNCPYSTAEKALLKIWRSDRYGSMSFDEFLATSKGLQRVEGASP